MRYFIAVLVIQLMVMAFPIKAYAYFEIFGKKVPTNIEEVKDVLGLQNKFVFKFFQEEKREEDKEEKETNQQVNGATHTNRQKEKSAFTRLSFSEGDVNDYVKRVVIGRKIYRNYKVKDGEINFGYDTFTVRADFENGVSLLGNFELNETGDDIVIGKVENVGEKKMSIIELSLLRVFLKTVPKQVINYFPDYGDKFSHVVITPDKVDIWFKNE